MPEDFSSPSSLPAAFVLAWEPDRTPRRRERLPSEAAAACKCLQIRLLSCLLISSLASVLQTRLNLESPNGARAADNLRTAEAPRTAASEGLGGWTGSFPFSALQLTGKCPSLDSVYGGSSVGGLWVPLAGNVRKAFTFAGNLCTADWGLNTACLKVAPPFCPSETVKEKKCYDSVKFQSTCLVLKSFITGLCVVSLGGGGAGVRLLTRFKQPSSPSTVRARRALKPYGVSCMILPGRWGLLVSYK